MIKCFIRNENPFKFSIAQFAQVSFVYQQRFVLVGKRL